MHHALLYIDDPKQCFSCIKGLQEELLVADGDVRLYEREKFLVEDARDLIRAIYTTPLAGENTLTMIATSGMSREAQNALLKIAEEPPAHAYVVLMVPSEDMLLPTLRSRFVRVGESPAAEDRSGAREFLASSVADRQKLVAKLVKNKDNLAARKLIRDIEVLLYERKDKEAYAAAIDDVMAFRQYIEQKGTSLKYLLEHLALTLPKFG